MKRKINHVTEFLFLRAVDLLGTYQILSHSNHAAKDMQVVKYI
jgi:hypothetical protein